MAAFEVDGKGYEVKYTIKRIEMYEASHRPIMAALSEHGGNMSVAELRDLIAYGLMLEGGGYVAPKQGSEMAEKLIETNGYLPVYQVAAEALDRDCGFLFKMSVD